MDPSPSLPCSSRTQKPLRLPHPSRAQHLLSLGLEYEGAAGRQAATKSINSKSYEESFVFPLLCAGVNGFAQQRSSPRDFLAASPDGASKASPPAERAPSKTLAGRAVTTPWSASTCKSPGPNTSQPRKRSSFSGRLPPPRFLLTHGAATLFALPCPDASHRFALPHRKLFTSTARPWQFGDSPVCSRIITSISSSRLF